MDKYYVCEFYLTQKINSMKCLYISHPVPFIVNISNDRSPTIKTRTATLVDDYKLPKEGALRPPPQALSRREPSRVEGTPSIKALPRSTPSRRPLLCFPETFFSTNSTWVCIKIT